MTVLLYFHDKLVSKYSVFYATKVNYIYCLVYCLREIDPFKDTGKTDSDLWITFCFFYFIWYFVGVLVAGVADINKYIICHPEDFKF